MRRPKLFLVLAVLSAFSAAIIVFSALRQREKQMQKALAERIEIVVAARDIALGQKLAPDDLKLVQWSRDAIPNGSFTDRMAPVGSYAENDFVAGEPIVQKKLVSAENAPSVIQMIIPRGMRAVAISLDAVGDIAGFVKPHTRVDVVVASSASFDLKPFARIVLQNVEVLAVDQDLERTEEKPAKPEYKVVVTLLVTPHQAEKLELAGRLGPLSLAMRNYTDEKVIQTSGSDLSDLLGSTITAAASAIGSPTIRAQGTTSGVEKPPPAARRAGVPPYRIRIMRDGKKLETLSFIAVSAPRPKAGRVEEELVPEPPAQTSPLPMRGPAALQSPVPMETPVPAHAALPDPSNPVSAGAMGVQKNIELP